MSGEDCATRRDVTTANTAAINRQQRAQPGQPLPRPGRPAVLEGAVRAARGREHQGPRPDGLPEARNRRRPRPRQRRPGRPPRWPGSARARRRRPSGIAAISSGGPAGASAVPATSSGAHAIEIQQGQLGRRGQAARGQQGKRPGADGQPALRRRRVRFRRRLRRRAAPGEQTRPGQQQRPRPDPTRPPATDSSGHPVSTATTAVRLGTAAASAVPASNAWPIDARQRRRDHDDHRGQERQQRRRQQAGQARPERQDPQREIAAGVGSSEIADEQQDRPGESHQHHRHVQSATTRGRPAQRRHRRIVRDRRPRRPVKAAARRAGRAERDRPGGDRSGDGTSGASRVAASTPTTSISRSANSSSHPPAAGPNGLARSVVSANNSGRLIRSISVSTARSASNLASPTMPPPAVAASPHARSPQREHHGQHPGQRHHEGGEHRRRRWRPVRRPDHPDDRAQAGEHPGDQQQRRQHERRSALRRFRRHDPVPSCRGRRRRRRAIGDGARVIGDLHGFDRSNPGRQRVVATTIRPRGDRRPGPVAAPDRAEPAGRSAMIEG